MTHLTENSYGKSSVRLTKVVRRGARHELMEMSVDICLSGDFSASYLTGDNSRIIATDSMKNTVYVLARENTFASIEEFAVLVARHFVHTYPQVSRAAITISQTAWQRHELHPHAFVEGGTERRTCSADLNDNHLELSGGVSDLRFLKTTGSEFTGFVTDRYRTLKDATDRIFATSLQAIWTYASDSADFTATFTAARAVILQTMADHHSLAAQQTLLAIGQAVLNACPAVRKISLTMPNLHRVMVDLKPFGLENPNEIFVPMDDPHGMITGVVERQ